MIQLSEEHRAIVAQILAAFPYQFYVFGSRAKNTAKSLSDLDLCIKNDEAIPLSTLAEIDAAFEESDLPFKVDVKVWGALSKRFQALIKDDLIVFSR